MKTVIYIFLMALSSFSWAQKKQPVVGRDAAAGYFQKKAPEAEQASGDHYLALHLGKFVSAESWEWAERGKNNNDGNFTLGVTYRISEWQDTMDFAVRVDFNEYKVAGQSPLKMSLLPVLLFPDASSKFPIYFGVGAGPGIFFKQTEGESSISLDYQLILGVRFFEVSGNTGFFIESGMKNHLLLTSDGQFNGTYLAGGALFSF